MILFDDDKEIIDDSTNEDLDNRLCHFIDFYAILLGLLGF